MNNNTKESLIICFTAITIGLSILAIAELTNSLVPIAILAGMGSQYLAEKVWS